jgi:hypothetical protein
MAQSEHLPIYKACYDLCLYFEQAVQGFSRYHRFSLGTDLRDLSRRALRLVVRANSQPDKVPALLELRETVEELKVVVRLCQDVKAFSSFRSFEHVITQLVGIAKQNEGWMKTQGAQRLALRIIRQGHGQSRRGMPEGAAVPGEPRSQGPPPA